MRGYLLIALDDSALQVRVGRLQRVDHLSPEPRLAPGSALWLSCLLVEFLLALVLVGVGGVQCDILRQVRVNESVQVVCGPPTSSSSFAILRWNSGGGKVKRKAGWAGHRTDDITLEIELLVALVVVAPVGGRAPSCSRRRAAH